MESKRVLKYFATFHRAILKSRYKVEVLGAESLNTDDVKLILPNHQALVDPLILFSQIWKKVATAPLVDEAYFENPLFKKFFESLGAIPVTDLEYEAKDFDLGSLLNRISNALEDGRSLVIYPEGRITSDGYAFLGGRKLAYLSAKNAPKTARFVAVRIRGLWGSMWSRAWMGKSPNFIMTYLKAIFIVFANIFFFVPKRKVSIEFKDLTNPLRKAENLTQFNKILEEFYNAKEENLIAKRHFFFLPCLKKRLYSHAAGSKKDLERPAHYKKEEIGKETLERIVSIVKNMREDLRERNIELDDNLLLDLYFDSLDIAELYMKIKNDFALASDTGLDKIKSVSDLCLIALGKFESRQNLPESLLESGNEKYKKLFSGPLKISSKNNILFQALKNLRKAKGAPLFYDAMIGSLSRRDFLLKAFVFAEYLKSFEGKYIGIMLPASAAAEIMILASYLADKTPVMINWTQSRAAQDKATRVLKEAPVISSQALYKKIHEKLSKELKNKLIFLELLKNKISLKHKIKALFFFSLPAATLSRKIKSDDTAVVLFSSGTESEPKTIPLSHKNILSNLSGAFSVFTESRKSIFFSALPPFHSFGFTVTSILPLISGVRFAYSPDPTDNVAVSLLIEKSGANVIGTAPSFLSKLLDLDSSKFKKVHSVIVGAEKCPKDLFDKAYSLGINIYEGYGLTECSPVVAVNPKEKPKRKSVGIPIKGLTIKIANPDKAQEKSAKKEGLILVRGDSVFNGYMEKNKNEKAFVIFEDSKKYFISGDLGYFDADGYLYISGRLKRFVKISGEMISLLEIEETLRKCLQNKEGNIAIVAKELSGKAEFLAVSEKNITIDDIRKCLQESDVNPLIKINKLKIINELPLLGTGKINYKKLEQDAENCFKEIQS